MYGIYFLLAAVCILVLQVQYTNSACTHDPDGNPRVGSSCEHTCHCKNASETCNNVTGQCISGCAKGWMGPGCQYRDLAFTFGTKTSDIDNKKMRARLAVDYDLTTCSKTDEPNSAAANARTAEPWWRLWMADMQFIQGLVIITEFGKEDLLSGFKVYVEESADKDDQTGFKNQQTCYTHDGLTLPNTTMYVYCQELLLGNQIRIQLATKQSQLVLCDVKIYEGRNLAYGKTANQISEHKTITGAALAVNGDMSTSVCSRTNRTSYPWWSVNLGQIYTIHGIRILEYQYGDYLSGYTLQARNESADDWITVYDDSNTKAPTANLMVSTTTRQLRLYWNSSLERIIVICEFEAIGDCPSYRCGLDCTEPCYCKSFSLKDRLSGICNAGCETRWTGANGKCNVCKDGLYGQQCLQTCENCKDGSACQKDTGHCPRGCSPGWRGDICEEEAPEPESRTRVPVGGIVTATIFIVIVLLIVLFVRLRRRNMRKQDLMVNTFELDKTSSAPDNDNNTTGSIQTKPDDRHGILINYRAIRSLKIKPAGGKKQPQTGSSTSKLPMETRPSKTGNIPIPKHAVCLTDLKKYIRSSSLEKDHFANEFNKLPYGIVHSTAVASKPTNRQKNRYTHMYAYDHSRVVLRTLPGQPDSDYINASFINGHKLKKAYIATQAPTIYNIDEFWRMVWEKEVTKIVMVANLIENGKVKCLRYWKKQEPSSYGSISVIIYSEEEFADFTVRKFIVKSIPQSKQRMVTQYQFTSWLDKSTPKGLTSLVQFWCKVRKDDIESSHPWLVHCSAGVGRTGTFIALDILYDQGKELNYVNVYQCVKELRRQRVNMVQNQEQYNYLHKVLFEALVLHTPAVPLQGYEHEYRNLLQVEKKTGITGLMSAFEMQSDSVCLSNEVLSNIQKHNNGTKDGFSSAKLPENRNKNRYNNILAANNYRPFLSYYVPGCNDYINAVYVPSSRDLRGYLLTQAPMEHTAVDCCRLINEKHIKIIVTFDDSGTERVGQYLPEKGSLTVGPFEMVLTKEENKTDYTIRHFNMEFKGQDQKCITQIAFRKWSRDDTVPQDLEAIINLLQEVEEKQRQSEGNPVLVQCLNGADRSGLFVVLMNVLETIRIDQEVAIPQVIRYMRQIRQQILPNYEQYKFCHEVVLRRIQNASPLANL